MTRITDSSPAAMILCGGQGTRLRDVSELLPKPMVPVGRQPILWHIMRGYAAVGVKRFILCLGYKREVILDYFLNFAARSSDVTVHLGERSKVTFHDPVIDDWDVTLADTGDLTQTGGRVARASRYLDSRDQEFFLTYGDGLSNVDLEALLQSHRTSGAMLTISAVHPSGRFGEMQVAPNGRLESFHEKPQTERGLINGGFMVVGRRFVSEYLRGGDGEALEDAPIRNAVADGVVNAYVHDGFWQCMDTPREHAFLNTLWASGKAPWTERWR
jgi:glucose-1-phosphate cytidylyltransferase